MGKGKVIDEVREEGEEDGIIAAVVKKSEEGVLSLLDGTAADVAIRYRCWWKSGIIRS